jgi:hypothetical protein
MIIRIDTDLVGETLSNRIDSKLSKADLPICIGNMSPPIVNSEMPFNLEDIVKHRQAIRPEEIAYDAIFPLVTSALGELNRDLVIDNAGKFLIEQRKEEISVIYAKHIADCVQCNHTDLCNKLTIHYIETVKLSLLNRIAEALERRMSNV